MRYTDWWRRLEVKRRLNEVPLPTLVVANRMGILAADTKSRDHHSIRMLCLGTTLFLILLTPLAAARFRNEKYHREHFGSSNEEEDVSGTWTERDTPKSNIETFDPAIVRHVIEEEYKLEELANQLSNKRMRNDFFIETNHKIVDQLCFNKLTNKWESTTDNFGTLMKQIEMPCIQKIVKKADDSSQSKEENETEDDPIIKRKSYKEDGTKKEPEPKRKSSNSDYGKLIPEEQNFYKYVHIKTTKSLFPMKFSNFFLSIVMMALTIYILVMVYVELREIIGTAIIDFVWRMLEKYRKLEEKCMDQNSLLTTVQQMVFFSTTERALISGQQLSALYTLMFCSIVTYCVGYVVEIVSRQEWNLIVRIGRTSSMRHLAMSATNIVLEWTKIVTFVTTVVFLLLMLSLEKGLHDYSPTWPYVILVSLFWITSEKVCKNFLFSWCLNHRLNCFDTLEDLYVPVVLSAVQTLLLASSTVACLIMGQIKLALPGCLFVRLEYLQVQHHHSKLKSRLDVLSLFRQATPKELSNLNDRCAICLSVLETARITSCQHYYHSECLLQLLSIIGHGTPKCPICQTDLAA